MSRLVCTFTTVRAALFVLMIPPPSTPALHVHFTRFVCMHQPCWRVNLYVFNHAMGIVSLPLWILIRCQLDFSQLITGCTWGVTLSLTHSHMLFSVLIFQLGHVMLASHSVHLLSFNLSPSVPSRCGSLA